MLVSCEKTGKTELTVELSISAEDFAKGIVEAIKKQRSKINVPGFRKGKAPVPFIEKFFGSEAFYEDGLDEAFPAQFTEAMDKAAEDLTFERVGGPRDVDISKISKAEGVEMKFKVSIKPAVEDISICEYKGIEAPKAAVSVSDEDVENKIKSDLDQNARYVDVDDRAVEDGDIATIDYKGLKDGVAFEGGTAEDHDLTIGSGQFIPGFEEQIIGHNIGEKFSIDVTFPENYGEKSLAGAPVVFEINLKGIKVKQIPELDDEFAKDMGFDTCDEYRDSVREELLKDREDRAQKDFENAVIDKLIDSVETEIPEDMIENELDYILDSDEYELRRNGLDLKTYVKYLFGSDDIETYRKMRRPMAERNVKLSLAYDKIESLESLEVSDEEKEKEYARVAELYGLTVEKLKEQVKDETVVSSVIQEKVKDIIISAAIATEPAEEPEESADAESAGTEAPAEE